jgi:2-polyprenyl-3-methyl-5-hydroxy-6-metoxy-1,4-benzoquinol methylase
LETSEALKGQHFDIFLAADVVEHLSNVGLFLSGVRSMMGAEDRLLITTPSAYSMKRMLSMALGRREHVHSDHTAYFSISTLTQILGRYDFQIEEAFGFQWKNPTAQNRGANALLAPIVWASGGMTCDELALSVKLGVA